MSKRQVTIINPADATDQEDFLEWCRENKKLPLTATKEYWKGSKCDWVGYTEEQMNIICDWYVIVNSGKMDASTQKMLLSYFHNIQEDSVKSRQENQTKIMFNLNGMIEDDENLGIKTMD